MDCMDAEILHLVDLIFPTSVRRLMNDRSHVLEASVCVNAGQLRWS